MANWQHYKALIKEKVGWENLPRDWEDIDSYKCWNWSLAGLWSWRGVQCKKYLGYMPSPDDIGLSADDVFYDPDFVDITFTQKFGGEITEVNIHHHGRKIRRTERLWRERVEPLLRIEAERRTFPKSFKWP